VCRLVSPWHWDRITSRKLLSMVLCVSTRVELPTLPSDDRVKGEAEETV
jgi:hypothetical protein